MINTGCKVTILATTIFERMCTVGSEGALRAATLSTSISLG